MSSSALIHFTTLESRGGPRHDRRVAFAVVGLLVVAGVFVAGAAPCLGQSEVPRDRDGDGLLDSEERDIGTNPSRADTDGDGLLDGWEVEGYWNGRTLEPLHLYGADPLRKDVFVEVDWMVTLDGSAEEGARVAYEAAVDITRVFRRRIAERAARENPLEPDEEIRVHFDLGVNIEALVPAESIATDVDFSAFTARPDTGKVLPYRESFPSRPAQGGLSAGLSLYEAYHDPHWFRPSRRNIFYYVVIAEQSGPHHGHLVESKDLQAFVDDFSDSRATEQGLQRIGVHATVVYRQPVALVEPELVRFRYGAMMLHELGHAFGLGHGGAFPDGRWDNSNNKANYVSVMNHRYVLWGVDEEDSRPVMGFSDGRFDRGLREYELVEHLGMGAALPNAHVRANLLVDHVEGTAWPNNLDWNGDGRLTGDSQRFDLNGNGVIDDERIVDHDDWGWLSERGFAGIGQRAFGDCGIACGQGLDVVSTFGDLDGDRRTDVLFAREDVFACARARVDGSLRLDPATVGRGEVGEWALNSGDGFVVDDFLDFGHDVLFVHSPHAAALLVYDEAGLAPRWVVEQEIPPAPTDGTDGEPVAPSSGWPLDVDDQYLPVRLDGGGAPHLAVTNGKRVGLLGHPPSAGPPGDEMGADGFGLLWEEHIIPPESDSTERFVLAPGRRLPDGTESFLVRSGESLYEVSGPFDRLLVSTISSAGVIGGSDAVPDGWQLSYGDCIHAADLDGDGVEEYVLANGDRLGVLQLDGIAPAIVWKADEHVVDPVTEDEWLLEPAQRLLVGRFGDEPRDAVVLVAANGLASLTWDSGTAALVVQSIQRHSLIGRDPSGEEIRWAFLPGQRVASGRFIAGRNELLLFQDNAGLLLAAFESSPPDEESAPGFYPIQSMPRRVDEWVFGPNDVLTVGDFDEDSQDELFAQKGESRAVFDFDPLPRVAFLMRLGSRSLTFEQQPVFQRGDVNSDGAVEITDAVRILTFLYSGPQDFYCFDAGDVDDSGSIDISDPIRLLNFLFSGGRAPVDPGVREPGIDPSLDAIDCNP